MPFDSSKIQAPMLGSLTEICIVTPDSKKTIDGLARLADGPFQVFRLNEHTCRGIEFQGFKGDFDIIACFAKQGGMVVEIMQPVSGRSLMREYLENNGGRSGLQHVAWGMEEGATEQRVKAMAARNIEVGMRGTWIGKTGTCQFTFFDTLDLIGTIFETIEFSDDWEDPPCEWYPHAPEVQQ